MAPSRIAIVSETLLCGNAPGLGVRGVRREPRARWIDFHNGLLPCPSNRIKLGVTENDEDTERG
jgi:hypothetical protein